MAGTVTSRFPSDPSTAWISASEVADYAYCPRSWWSSRHPPEGGRDPASERSSRAGIRYHERVLAAEWRRERAGTAYWVLLALALVLVVGGLLWIPL